MKVHFVLGSTSKRIISFKILIPALVVLLILILLSLKLFLGWFYFEKAKTVYNEKEDSERNFAMTQGLFFLEKSLWWHSQNPSVYAFRASLLYREGRTFSEESSEELKQALMDIEKAIALKPRWPFYYVQKARIHAISPELDTDFYSAFDKAYALGRYETNTALRLLRLGIHQWPKLSEPTRNRVIDLMHLSLQQKSNSPKDLWHLLDRSNLVTWFCFHLPPSSRQEILCSYKR